MHSTIIDSMDNVPGSEEENNLLLNEAQELSSCDVVDANPIETEMATQRSFPASSQETLEYDVSSLADCSKEESQQEVDSKQGLTHKERKSYARIVSVAGGSSVRSELKQMDGLTRARGKGSKKKAMATKKPACAKAS